MTAKPSTVLEPAAALNAAVHVALVVLVLAVGPFLRHAMRLAVATRTTRARRIPGGTARDALPQPAAACTGRVAVFKPAVARAVTHMTALVSAHVALVTSTVTISMRMRRGGREGEVAERVTASAVPSSDTVTATPPPVSVHDTQGLAIYQSKSHQTTRSHAEGVKQVLGLERAYVDAARDQGRVDRVLRLPVSKVVLSLSVVRIRVGVAVSSGRLLPTI